MADEPQAEQAVHKTGGYRIYVVVWFWLLVFWQPQESGDGRPFEGDFNSLRGRQQVGRCSVIQLDLSALTLLASSRLVHPHELRVVETERSLPEPLAAGHLRELPVREFMGGFVPSAGFLLRTVHNLLATFSTTAV